MVQPDGYDVLDFATSTGTSAVGAMLDSRSDGNGLWWPPERPFDGRGRSSADCPDSEKLAGISCLWEGSQRSCERRSRLDWATAACFHGKKTFLFASDELLVPTPCRKSLLALIHELARKSHRSSRQAETAVESSSAGIGKTIVAQEHEFAGFAEYPLAVI